MFFLIKPAGNGGGISSTINHVNILIAATGIFSLHLKTWRHSAPKEITQFDHLFYEKWANKLRPKYIILKEQKVEK